ncbi:hypothetical protein PVAP13_1KG534404 [Panicum virgatum]|uniref:Uncharacterized protein n=1 Tax=Panicum virgatum TaxID=38727 RepID=A0A8T0XQP4_PANVG|nr:hypothetical protein PVAP13_1KG534404 [Panicum virgatum]
MAVEILESCMVTPGEAATPKHGVWLSNLDLLVARSHTPTVYVYRPSPGPAFFSPDVLKAALSKVLVPFYPLAGRLGRDGAGRPEIHCAGEAAPRPWLDRTLLRARSPPAVRFDHAEYSRRGGGGSKVPFDSAILPVSKAQIDALKAGKKLSTFKAVVAHVWRCACKARGLAATEDTRLYMTADARSRVRPPLPEGYLGNAIFRASTVAKVGDVVSEPLDAAADRISGATARLDDEYIRSLVDHLEQAVSDAAGLRKGEWVMPETDLWVISWQGLPIYDADFGWGRPAFMNRACLQFSGLVYLVPGPDGDGRLDVVVAMEPKSLARFKELLYEELK